MPISRFLGAAPPNDPEGRFGRPGGFVRPDRGVSRGVQGIITLSLVVEVILRAIVQGCPMRPLPDARDRRGVGHAWDLGVKGCDKSRCTGLTFQFIGNLCDWQQMSTTWHYLIYILQKMLDLQIYNPQQKLHVISGHSENTPRLRELDHNFHGQSQFPEPLEAETT